MDMFMRVTSLSDLQPNVYGRLLRGKVVFVNDGDLLQFFHVPWLRSPEHDGEPTLSIQLAGIDAPERHQPFYFESKEKLKELVLNEIVNLKLLGVDQYDRILAICYNTYFQGLSTADNVNAKMVEVGMASVYRGRDAAYDGNEDDLLRLEEEARKREIGIWSRRDYVSPMQYRRNVRDRVERDRINNDRNENQCICM